MQRHTESHPLRALNVTFVRHVAQLLFDSGSGDANLLAQCFYGNIRLFLQSL